MHSDEAIMQAVAAGDLQQLSQLYRRYRDPLYGFLLRRANEPAVAEDLLQAVFERVIKYRSSYKGPSFRSWLYAIARNALHDRQRREGRMPRKNGVDLGELPLTTPSVESDWEDREIRSQSLAALAALPANYREVVDLAWKRGLKYAEIAAVLGISEANVKVRMYRATKQLKVNYAKLSAR
ncbi:MAG: sigma-70 family RNA polymerase sigma factor [Bacteroidota bacterium]